MTTESKNPLPTLDKQNKEVAAKNGTQGYGDDWVNRPRERKENFSTLAASDKLPIVPRIGFRRHWVIEREIPEFERRDWKPATENGGKPTRVVMNTGKYNRDIKEPEYGILMEIPEVYFQQNLKADDDERKALSDRRSPTQNQPAVVDGQTYVKPPAFENKIERNKPIG